MNKTITSYNYVKNSTERIVQTLNELNTFMKTLTFYNLTRENKMMLYEQYRMLIDLVEHSGIIAEGNNIKIDLPTATEEAPRPDKSTPNPDPFKIGRPIGIYKPWYKEDNPYEFPNITVGEGPQSNHLLDPFQPPTRPSKPMQPPTRPSKPKQRPAKICKLGDNVEVEFFTWLETLFEDED